MAAFLEGLFGSASEENKNKVREQRRRDLLNSETRSYNSKEMKAARNILEMKATQPGFDKKKMRDAGQHMAVNRYKKKDGEAPSYRKQGNRRKLRSGKKSTSRESLNTRTLNGDNDMSKLSHEFDSGTKLKTIISDFDEDEEPYAKYDNKKQKVTMGGKRTRKRRRKRRRKTKRKGRRKTKKRRKMRKRKTKRRR